MKDIKASTTRLRLQTQANCFVLTKLGLTFHSETPGFFPSQSLSKGNCTEWSHHAAVLPAGSFTFAMNTACLTFSLFQTTLHPSVMVFTGQKPQVIQIPLIHLRCNSEVELKSE